MNEHGQSSYAATALVNGRIVLPDRVVTGQALVIEGGRIAGLADAGRLGPDVERVDVAGQAGSPPASSTSTPTARCGTPSTSRTAEAWTVITRENLRRGTTALLATFAPTPDLEEGLAFCRQWMHEDARRRAGAGRVPGKPLHQRRSEGRARPLVRARCR